MEEIPILGVVVGREQVQMKTNNYSTTSTFPNLYVTRKLNNMDKARLMKDKRNDQMKIYYKMLKELEVMIDIQRQVKDMMKIAVETNMMITEMDDSILKASINN